MSTEVWKFAAGVLATALIAAATYQWGSRNAFGTAIEAATKLAAGGSHARIKFAASEHAHEVYTAVAEANGVHTAFDIISGIVEIPTNCRVEFFDAAGRQLRVYDPRLDRVVTSVGIPEPARRIDLVAGPTVEIASGTQETVQIGTPNKSITVDWGSTRSTLAEFSKVKL